MRSGPEEISGISDVGYLLTRLRLAKRKNEPEIERAIVSRLEYLGLLKDERDTADVSFKNLRAIVDSILGTDSHSRAYGPSQDSAETTSA